MLVLPVDAGTRLQAVYEDKYDTQMTSALDKPSNDMSRF